MALDYASGCQHALVQGFFKKIDTGFAKNRLEQEISVALQAETDLHLLDEPEFDYDDA